MKVKKPSVDAAESALVAHRTALGIQGDHPTQLWHLLMSLDIYCQAKGLNLDATLAEVRSDRPTEQNVSSDECEGWFDVNAYKTQERYDGPDLADDILDGFINLQDAIDAANSPEYADYYQVTVVAYGKHKDYEPGEGAFTRFKRP